MPEFGLAGAERMCEDLSLGLEKSGDEVRVVSFFNYHSVITDTFERVGIKTSYLGKKRGLDPSIVSKLKRVCAEFRPDITHSHRYCQKYLIAAMSAGLCGANVHTIHNVAEREVGALDKRLARVLYRRHASTPVAISPLVRNSICRLYGLSEREVPIIYNGVSRSFPPRTRCDDAEFHLLHVGRYSEQKNHELLIRGFALAYDRCPNVRLTLLGSGERFEAVAELISELGLTDVVNQVGPVDDVGPYMADADAFVLPSLYEGMPMSLIEAELAGLPAIVTPVGGVPDVVRDGIEALYCDQTPESLADAMTRCAMDSSLLNAMRVAARENGRRFSRKRMVDAYRTLYKALVEEVQ